MKTDLEVKNRVREILKMVQEVAPGKAVELRVPPYAAIQSRAGKPHRRGTPSNVVEMNGKTLITVFYDPSLWGELCLEGEISASGQLSDLSEIFAQIGKLKPAMLERK